MAVQLGASGYITKPYLEEALLDAAQRMLGEVLVTTTSNAKLTRKGQVREIEKYSSRVGCPPYYLLCRIPKYALPRIMPYPDKPLFYPPTPS